MSSLRGQLIKCFNDFISNSQILFAEKNERSFCTAKASYIFSTKNIGVNVGNFNEALTNDVVRFEQPGPTVLV